MTHDLLDDLRQEISQGHVLVVVGSGVSIGATGKDPLASWQGLLENGVDRCVAVRGLSKEWEDRVKAEIQSGIKGDMDDLLSAAEKVSSKLGFPSGFEYRDWLRDTVGPLKAKDRTVLEALRDLNLPLATTNYDGLLEEVTGDIALRRSDHDTARARFVAALDLYKRIQEPYSIGVTHVRLARLASEEADERRNHLHAAQEAWESINRPDLVEWLRKEFGEIP